VGLAVLLAFTVIIASFMGSYFIIPNPTLPPSPLPEQLWLWTYREFDILFLFLTVFVTIVGAAALFRTEEAGPEEEVFVEGVEEEISEEEEE